MPDSPARHDDDAHDDASTAPVSSGEFLLDTRTDTMYVVVAVNDDDVHLKTAMDHDDLTDLMARGDMVSMGPFLTNLHNAMSAFVEAVAEVFRPMVEAVNSMFSTTSDTSTDSGAGDGGDASTDDADAEAENLPATTDDAGGGE